MTDEIPKSELEKQALIEGTVSDEMERKLFELSALFEISQLLNSSLNLTAIADNILLSPMGRMMINRGFFLLHRGDGDYEMITLKGLPRDLIGKKTVIHDLPRKPFLHTEIPSGETGLEFLADQEIRLFLPIVLRNDALGLIGYGKKLSGGGYKESEIEFLSSLANIAATSIQNGLVYDEIRRVNKQLDRKIQELNTLFDIGKGLQSTLDAKQIIKLLGYGLMGAKMLNKFVILLQRHAEPEIAERKGLAAFELSREHMVQLFGVSHPYLTEDAESSDIDAALSRQDITAVIPMRSQDRTKGVLLIGHKMHKQSVQADELDFLFTLGNQAMTALENAWLFEDSIERRRLEEELALARKIQQRLLPTAFPALDGFEIFGLNISSKQVGGDYLDVIRIDDHRYLLAIADVSGKGVPASLLMSNLQASLLALTPDMKSLSSLVARVNNIIFANTDSDKFITCFCGILDTGARTLTCVNAGHNPPYRIQADGSLQTLEKGGLLLGMIPDMPYEEEVIPLHPGESVVMFTDGVTEAMNEEQQLFDEPRLEKILTSNPDMPAQPLVERIVQEVKHFAGAAPQSDDITILIVHAK